MTYRINIQTEAGFIVVESDFRLDKEVSWMLVREAQRAGKVPPFLPDGVRVRFKKSLP